MYRLPGVVFRQTFHKMDIISGDCYAGPESGAFPLKTDQKIMAIASGGGHWVQLMRLRPAFDGMNVFYVSMDPSAAVDVPLRQHKPSRGLRRTTLSGGSIAPESLRIIHRPAEIEGRLVPGHWEGDLIKGAFNRSAVGTVVERKTRYLILSKMRGCTADAALEGFTRQMKRLPAVLRRSMTYDRGSEMACHPELARRLKIDIWFCDPHAPRPRGSNENTNGLRRYD